MRRPLPLPGAPAQPATPYSEDEDTKEDEKHISPLIGLAGAAGAATLGANLADNEDDLLPPPPSSSTPQGSNTFSSANSSKTADETTRPTGSSGTSRGAGPDIIAFGPRPRTTAKLPAAPAAPAGQGVISHIIPGASTPTATVTITPKSKLVADNFVITAVTGTPDPKSRQVQAHILMSPPSPAQSATANATGSIAGTHATGTLLFI